MKRIVRSRTTSNKTKNRMYYLITMIVVCFFIMIAVGYSVLTSIVQINGTAQITSTWRVLFTKAVEHTMDGATTTSGPTITGGTNLFVNVQLERPGSQAIYDVTVENQGTMDAVVKEIRGVQEMNEKAPLEIQVAVDGIITGEELSAGEKKEFQLIVTWDPNAELTSENVSKEITISIDFAQKTESATTFQLKMPTYTLDQPNDVWSSEKNVTMIYPEGDNLLYQYSQDGGKSWLVSPSRVFTLKYLQAGSLYIRVTDGVSSLTTPLILIEKVDHDVPEVSISGNLDSWATFKVISIVATDSISGLAPEPYSWDGGLTWSNMDSQRIVENQTLDIRVKDNAGNITRREVEITKIDREAPTDVSLRQIDVSSSSLKVEARATQNGLGIRGYQFSINGVWSEEQTDPTMEFTGLSKHTNYQIAVRVYGKNGTYTESESYTFTTNDIQAPTYALTNHEDGTKSVTITYEGTKTSNLIYEYSLDGGNHWVEVNGSEIRLDFVQEGMVIARVRDVGNNNNVVTASTFTVTF